MGLKPTKNKSKPRIKCVRDAQKKCSFVFFSKENIFFTINVTFPLAT